MDTWMGYNSDPQSLHKYTYANVDPVNNIDPSGHFSIGSVMTAINVAGSLASAATAGYRFGQIATGQREFSAREIGMTEYNEYKANITNIKQI